MQDLTVSEPAFQHDRLRLSPVFDAGRMHRDVSAMPGEAWIDHFVTQNYEGGWSVLPLRSTRGATHPVTMAYSDPTATAFDDTPWLARAPYLRQVIDSFACPLRAVRLMRLTPGSFIKPHRDHDLSAADGQARLHIPVTTNPDVDFRLNDIRLDMSPGSLWYLRLSDVHQVRNNGASDRVHLVLDCAVDRWLLDLLNAAA